MTLHLTWFIFFNTARCLFCKLRSHLKQDIRFLYVLDQDQCESHTAWHTDNKMWNMQMINTHWIDLKQPYSHESTHRKHIKMPLHSPLLLSYVLYVCSVPWEMSVSWESLVFPQKPTLSTVCSKNDSIQSYPCRSGPPSILFVWRPGRNVVDSQMRLKPSTNGLGTKDQSQVLQHYQTQGLQNGSPQTNESWTSWGSVYYLLYILL